MKILGRLLVRKDKTVGLYIPFSKDLESGIYEVREVMGELQVVPIGQPAMHDGRYQGLSPNELVGDPTAGMTQVELDSVV